METTHTQRKASVKDIQLRGIKHAKQAIVDLLNDQSEIAAERDRLKAENAELRAALEGLDALTVNTKDGLIGGIETGTALIMVAQKARAAIAKARGQ